MAKKARKQNPESMSYAAIRKQIHQLANVVKKAGKMTKRNEFFLGYLQANTDDIKSVLEEEAEWDGD